MPEEIWSGRVGISRCSYVVVYDSQQQLRSCSFAAAAAALRSELTLPDVSQTVILTRTAMKSSAMPQGEDLATLAKSGATLAIHLSIRNIRAVVETLSLAYGADCPVAIVYRVTWPDQLILRGTLADIV